MNENQPRSFRGHLMRGIKNRGSKSESTRYFLKTPEKDYQLKPIHSRTSFENCPEFDVFLNKLVKVTGVLVAGHTIVNITEVEETNAE